MTYNVANRTRPFLDQEWFEILDSGSFKAELFLDGATFGSWIGNALNLYNSGLPDVRGWAAVDATIAQPGVHLTQHGFWIVDDRDVVVAWSPEDPTDILVRINNYPIDPPEE